MVCPHAVVHAGTLRAGRRVVEDEGKLARVGTQVQCICAYLLGVYLRQQTDEWHVPVSADGVPAPELVRFTRALAATCRKARLPILCSCRSASFRCLRSN